MMLEPSPIDYMIIGHVAKDITTGGPSLGGTVSFAGRTALSMGYRVGAITSCWEHYDLSPLEGIQIVRYPSRMTTAFENIYSLGGRTQKLLSKALDLGPDSIPLDWLSTRLIHLGPIAREVDPTLIELFPSAFIGVTPQGWLRQWDSYGQIQLTNWKTIKEVLPRVDAVVLSIEDMMNDEEAVLEMAQHCRVLAVTRAAQGVSIFVEGRHSDLPAMEVQEIESTGAGDIFAAIFFIRFYETGDPFEAGQFANRVASISVTRKGIRSTPTKTELELVRNEIYP